MRMFLLASASLLALFTADAEATTFDYTGNFQTFTVPETGFYDITAVGARGGTEAYALGPNAKGGFGAKVTSDDFSLTAGEVLTIVVGGRGANGDPRLATYGAGGGGGGTFVLGPGETPFLIAGGGGGGGATSGADGAHAVDGPDGTSGQSSHPGAGGSGGSGGGVDETGFVYSSSGGGGGGLNGDGEAGDNSLSGGGSLADGFGGGNGECKTGGPLFAGGCGGGGGFGGGGGGGGGFGGTGGGGGGYSGGGGGGCTEYTCTDGGYGGGAGGSYNDQSFSVANVEDGLVTITPDLGVPSVPEPSTWAMMLAGFVSLGLAGYRRARTASRSAA